MKGLRHVRDWTESGEDWSKLNFALDECVIAADAAMQAYHEATTL